MSVDPVALVERYHAALNHYDAAVVTPMFAEHAVYVSRGVNGRIEGRDKIIAAFSAYFAEHPDQVGTDEKVERTGPLQVRTHWRLVATSASSGKRVYRHGTQTITFNDLGLILRVDVEDQC